LHDEQLFSLLDEHWDVLEVEAVEEELELVV
jgi:hypothetical protein